MLKALVGKVVVERDEKQHKIGNILVPDSSQEKPHRGRIVSIWLTREMQVEFAATGSRYPRKGDFVYFGKYSGNEITCEGKEYALLREEDLLAIEESGEEAA